MESVAMQVMGSLYSTWRSGKKPNSYGEQWKDGFAMLLYSLLIGENSSYVN